MLWTRAWLQCGGHDRDDSKNTTNLFDSPRQLLHPPKIRAKRKKDLQCLV